MVRIPSEYQEVEYLESTGTQYIDLPFGFDPTDEIETRFSITDTRYNDRYIVSPVEWNTDRNRFAMGIYVIFAVGYGGSSTGQTRFTPAIYNDFKIHDWKYENYTFFVKDLELSRDVSSINFGSTTADLRLFYGYSDNTKGQIVYYKHIKQDGTGCNLIPCYRKSDNEPGMYDTVAGTFYTNQGTGTFLKGNDVTYDPINLLEVRRRIIFNNRPNILYEAWNLSFNGTSEYIDTGIYLFTQENINRDFEFIAEGIAADNSKANNTIICAKHNGNAYGFLVRIQNDNNTRYNGTIFIWPSPSSIVIRRINGVISLNGTNINNPGVQFTNAVFDWPLVLGCAIDDNGNPYRYRNGTIDHVCVKWL